MSIVVVSTEAGCRVSPRMAKRTEAIRQTIERITDHSYKAVSLVFVTDVSIRRFNKVYRKHDRITDVLSFVYEPRPIIGEVLISLSQAARQAKRMRHSLDHELDLLIVHGMLHLAGYDHMKKSERVFMRSLEQKILARLK